MQQNVARRPRFQRVSDFPNTRLTERDRAIISAIARFRFLSTGHILSLVPGSRQNIVRRLQRLYHAGFLDRPHAQLPLRFAGYLFEMVYAPSQKTHVRATEEGTVSGKKCGQVSSLFLRHALSVSDSLIAVELACRQRGLVFTTEQDIVCLASKTEVAKHLRWRVTLKSGEVNEKVGIIPDAAFAIERRNHAGNFQRFYFFLEADRGTMPIRRRNLRLSSIYRKALAYSKTRRNGVLKDRFGIPGFQVLFITQSKNRLERMNEVCSDALQGRNTSLFLFATPDELKCDPLTKLGML
jgi:hypothetical protein